MADAFIGEIRIFPTNFAPENWAFCNGQLLPISQNPALFSLLGTYYGGDGKSTFALPDLQGRTPVHTGFEDPPVYNLGARGGVESHPLNYSELAPHSHTLYGVSETATSAQPGGNRIAAGSGVGSAFGTGAAPVAMAAGSVAAYQNSAVAHNNMQPYLVLNFCICLSGIFPARH